MKLTQFAICKVCRSEFQVRSTGRKPAYCSLACKQKAYRSRKSNENTVTELGSWFLYSEKRPLPGQLILSLNINFLFDESSKGGNVTNFPAVRLYEGDTNDIFAWCSVPNPYDVCMSAQQHNNRTRKTVVRDEPYFMASLISPDFSDSLSYIEKSLSFSKRSAQPKA